MADATYAEGVPKLWDETIKAHRRSVRDAILDAAAALVGKAGLRAVTMSQIAEEAGIGRATLYRYFTDVDAMLLAWHERQVSGHLERLDELGSRPGPVGERLLAVLEAYASIHHELAAHHGSGPPPGHSRDVAVLLHRGEHVARAQERLTDFVRALLAEAASTGDVRDDIAPDELARYCLHTLAAAADLPSRAAVRRLVRLTLDGLRAR